MLGMVGERIQEMEELAGSVAVVERGTEEVTLLAVW